MDISKFTKQKERAAMLDMLKQRRKRIVGSFLKPCGRTNSGRNA